jgi:hypothetical protein
LFIYQVYLRAQGKNPKEHPINREVERIKGYIQKIQKMERKKEARKRLKVYLMLANATINAEAAKKFVRNALFDVQK